MIAAEHRNFGKALEVIDRAIALAPQKAEYFAHRGRCLIALQPPARSVRSRRPGARARAARRADARHDRRRHDARRRACRGARTVPPRRRARSRAKPAYHYNLGASLQFVGELQRGRSASTAQALRLEPRFHRAWSSLAQVARCAADAGRDRGARARSSRSRRSTRTPSCISATRSRSSTRTRAATNRRFGCLERGKRRKAATLGYDFARRPGAVRGRRERLPTALAGRAGEGCASREPIFIVGMPRTGTTLVERILSSHPQRLLGRRAHELRPRAEARDGDARRTASWMPKHWRPARAATSRPSAQAYVESTRPRTGHTPRFIDKMPLNFFYAPLIQRALPNAKIICLRRNPLDTCLSNYRQLFATSFSYYNYAYDLLDTGRYYAAFDALTAHWRDAPTEELPRGSVRGRRRPHRARGAPARRVLRAALGPALPRLPGQRRARRDGELRAGPPTDLPVRASSGGGTTSASLRRCANCSLAPASCDRLLDCPHVAGGQLEFPPERRSFFAPPSGLPGSRSSPPRCGGGSPPFATTCSCSRRSWSASRWSCWRLRLGAAVPPGQLVVSVMPRRASRWRSSAAFGCTAAKRVGMRAWRIRVVRDDGGPLGWRRAVARFGAALVAALPAGLGLWWSVFDSRRSAAGTTAGRALESCGAAGAAKR